MALKGVIQKKPAGCKEIAVDLTKEPVVWPIGAPSCFRKPFFLTDFLSVPLQERLRKG